MVLEWLSNPEVWASLVTLTALEIVLGIDNLVFLAILAARLPPEQQNRARQIGLAVALVSRLALLVSQGVLEQIAGPRAFVERDADNSFSLRRAPLPRAAGLFFWRFRS